MCHHPAFSEYKVRIGETELYIVFAQRIYLKAISALLATIKDENPSATKEDVVTALEEHYGPDQILFYDKEPDGCYTISF